MSMGLLHLLYVILYSIIVISLLISYDLFVKNFKKLHLRYSFKIIIGLILFVSQMYFTLSDFPPTLNIIEPKKLKYFTRGAS